MFNFDCITKKTQKNIIQIVQKFLAIHIKNLGFLIWKKNKLLGLINHESDIDKIHLFAKDPYEAKYQLLINRRESTGIKYLNDSKAFMEYSNDTDDIYKNTEEYNPNKKGKY